jgi:hypothetical protein
MEEDRLKLEIPNGRFTVKMTHLPIHHHGDCRMSPIVSILSEQVVYYDNMPYE